MVSPAGKAFWIATCLDCTWRTPRLCFEGRDKKNRPIGRDPMAEAQRRADVHRRETEVAS